MSKGYPTVWPAAVASARIRQLCRKTLHHDGANLPNIGRCECQVCQEIRHWLFGSTTPLPRDRRGFTWRTIRLRDVTPLSRSETQTEIAAHFDRQEPRTHPDLH